MKTLILDRKDILAVTHNRCWLCGKFMARKGRKHLNKVPPHLRKMMITKDHIIPRVKGGTGINNLMYAHHDCNTRRGDFLSPAMLLKAKMIMIAAAAYRLSK